MRTFYCLFEQSGTFKNAFKKLGYQAFDFDIQNEYGETDFLCDLYNPEIIEELLDKAEKDNATLIMFFPCTFFSAQQILWTRGVNYSQRDWNLVEKLYKSRNNIVSTSRYYDVFCLWVANCVSRNIPLIIENPYNPQSFLLRYFPIQPTIIDKDRRRLGDKFQKPTMWYFINCQPSENYEMMYPTLFDDVYVTKTKYGKERSEISVDYATNFIKCFIL